MDGKSRQCALLLVLVAFALAPSIPYASARKKDRPATQMEEPKRVLHALNRLTFGPRPGDVQRVLDMGLDRWIDLQLHPGRIDDSALDSRLAPLRTLRMGTRQLVENFPSPEVIKASQRRGEPLPNDPVKRAVYESQLDRQQARQDKKQSAAADPNSDPSASGDDTRTAHREDRQQARQNAGELLSLPPDQRMKQILQMPPDDRRVLLTSLKGDQRDQLLDGLSPEQRETLMALNNPQQVVVEELAQGKLLRAVYSERQLEEVMTDFWFNHFNVFIGKGADRYLITSYERDVIRPHALGKFGDLLVATAQSPAMLFYLDNWVSVGPNSDAAKGIPKNANLSTRKRYDLKNASVKQARGKRGGLNENYGRELMELHTLGVNGGYTQQDVTEVARVFTGWTIRRPMQGDGFTFEPRMHEPGDKTVLGHRIKPNGEKEGREMLHLLAHHPATAKFVCTKLAMRFVSDNPPPSLIDRMSHTFLKKDGDIREVLKTMLASPEFWSEDAYRAKVKTPLEFVVSAVRATSADVGDAAPLARALNSLGMPLYGMQPPTGYSMKAETWVSSSALLARMNFALALANDRMRNIAVDTGRMLNATPRPNDAEGALAALENSLLSGEVSKQTHDTIASRLEDPQITRRRLDDEARPPNIAMIAGLLLGSPEFQRR